MRAFRWELAFVLALALALVSPAGPLNATGPMIGVTPSGITAGGAVSVGGSGFSAGESVIVRGPTFGTTVTADSSGVISTPGLHGDPNLATGTYLVVATGQTSGMSSTATLAVTAANPQLSLSVSSIMAGGTFTANASGFETGENVCFAGDPPASAGSNCVAADSAGNASLLLHVHPKQPAGPAYVIRAGGQSTLRRAFQTLQVTAASPTLTTSPSNSVPAGTSVTATAAGFFGTETVNFGGGPFSSPATPSAAATNGTASESPFIATCAAVSGSGTTFTGTAKGQTSGLMASTQLTITPIGTIALSPTSVAPGPSVNVAVSGSGFASGDSFNVIGPFQGSPSPVNPSGATPSASATVWGQLQPASNGYTVWLQNTGASGSSHCSKSISLGVSGGTAGVPLTLSPSSIATGQTVTVSGGTSFTGTATISMPFGVNVTGITPTAGAINTTFVVPTGALPGTYSVRASDGINTANAPLTITAGPSLSVSPSPVQEGGSVTLTASNFKPGDTVTFNMPGLPQNSVTATVQSDGTALATPIVQYGPFPGTYYAFASNGTTQVATAVTLQRAQPAISLPSTVSAGGSLTITGSGFAPAETVKLDGPLCSSLSACSLATLFTPSPVSTTADASGAFTANVAVPYLAKGGLHQVHASGVTSGLGATQSLTVTGFTPAVSVNPTSAAPGATVTVSGSGFAGNETISLQLPLQPPFTATASSGSFSTTFVVSSCQVNGLYALTAVGQTSGLGAATPFTVTGGPTSVPAGCGVVPTSTPVPVATLAPTSGGGGPAPSAPPSPPPGVSQPVVSVLANAGISLNVPPVPPPGVAAAPAAVPVPLAPLAQGALVLPVTPQLTQTVLSQVLVAPAPVPVSAAINPAQGGVVVAGNVAVTFPPQALASVIAAQPAAPGQPPAAPANVNVNVTQPTNVPIPGGPAQFSPNGTILDISITNAATGQPITTFPAPIPVTLKYNAADVGQSGGHPENLTAAYVIDANSPAVENPLQFPIGTFVIFPPSATTRDLANGVITVRTQAIGSVLSVVTNPVGYVQTVNPDAQLQSSFDPNSSQSFGSLSQFSYLQVVEPQIGTRLLVLNPATGNYAYVNATDVGPSGPPPPQSVTAVVRGLLSP